mgnify:CR=1 FL=1
MLFFLFRSVLFFGLLHVFLCNRQHQLDTVLLVDLRRARIVINRHNIRLRVQVFQEKLKILAPRYVEKNLAVFSHGQFLQLLIMQIQQPRLLTKELMQQFRSALMYQPIRNSEFFIY